MIGTPTARIRIPITGVAMPRPCSSIRKVLSGDKTAPPSETPVDEMAIAQARRCTNHRARVALTATPALMPEPIASRM